MPLADTPFSLRSLWTWLVAKQLSDVSASLNAIVISVYALALFDSPAILGFILALKMAGSVMGAFLVPVMSRRWPHHSILIVSDFANAGLMLVLALAPMAAHPVLIVVAPFFMGVFQGTFHVSLYSQASYFLGRDHRHRMNSILASIDGVGVVVGGILASIVYGLISVRVIFFIDAATFLLSGLAFLGCCSGKTAVDQGLMSTEVGQVGLRGLSVTVWRTIAVTVGLLFLARFVEAFGSATHNVGLPIISAAYDVQNQAFLVGWIMALWGAGKMAASIVTPASVRLLERSNIDESHMFIVFLILTFVFFLGVFAANSLLLILLCAFLAGLFDASTETVYYSILQHSPVARTDQLISLSYFVERAGMGLGIIVVGYAFSVGPARQVSEIFYLGSVAICILLLASAVFKRKRACEIK